jgi:hypothetical protein
MQVQEFGPVIHEVKKERNKKQYSSDFHVLGPAACYSLMPSFVGPLLKYLTILYVSANAE